MYRTKLIIKWKQLKIHIALHFNRKSLSLWLVSDPLSCMNYTWELHVMIWPVHKRISPSDDTRNISLDLTTWCRFSDVVPRKIRSGIHNSSTILPSKVIGSFKVRFKSLKSSLSSIHCCLVHGLSQAMITIDIPIVWSNTKNFRKFWLNSTLEKLPSHISYQPDPILKSTGPAY